MLMAKRSIEIPTDYKTQAKKMLDMQLNALHVQHCLRTY